MEETNYNELLGPYVIGYYDWSYGKVTLFHENGEVKRFAAFYSGFTSLGKEKILRDLDSDRIIYSIEQEKNYLRVNFQPQTKREDITYFISRCEERKIPFLEGDVNPVRRWFSDTGGKVSRKFKSLFFDLETHPGIVGFDDEAKKTHRIISCAAYDLEGRSWFWAAKESSIEEEGKIIHNLLEVARDYDTLLAWNGNNYDFYVLQERAKLLQFQTNWRRWNFLDYMEVVKKLLMSVSDPNMKRSFALDAIGENVLGIRKIKLEGGGKRIHELLGKNEAKLEEYNRRDVEIMIELEKKRSFLELHYALCSLSRTFPGKSSLYPSELADGVLLRMAITDNVHFATKIRYENRIYSDKFEGAYVMNPKQGFHEDVQVADFASLYPSIIISWNMSPETKLKNNGKYSRSVIENAAFSSATGIRFRTDFEGIIPKALRILIEKRKEYSNQLKDFEVGSEAYKSANNLSTAVKVVANSFYGLLGSEASRYYDRDIARSVTLTGQFLVKRMIEEFKSRGHETVASDTDSVFVKIKPDLMKTCLTEINEVAIPAILSEQKCPRSIVKLDSDKGFSSLLIVTKKRYAGILDTQKGRKAPPGTLEIKGLETQRSDQIRYAQRLQKEFLVLLLRPELTPEEVETRMTAEGEKFYFQKIEADDIEIMEGVSKHPDAYTTKNAAVDVARWMLSQGEEFFVGMKIPYIIIEDTPNLKAIHISQYNGRFDRAYYWKNRILPPLTRLIESRFPKYPFRDFSNPAQLEFRWSMPTRKIKVPKTAPTYEKKVRMVIPGDKVSVRELKTVKKVIDAFPGNIKVELKILVNEAEVDIETKENISNEGLNLIRKNLPHVEIIEFS